MQVLDSVLLVDDDAAVNFYHRSLINKLGLAREIIQTSNGREAFNFIENNYHNNKSLPSLVLLDLAMPKMDGIELLRHLHESNLLGVKKIPIAIVTTSDQERYQNDLSQLGEFSFLSKPLSEVNFVGMLQKTIVPTLNSPNKINFINELHRELSDQMEFLKQQNAYLLEQRIKINQFSQDVREKFKKYKDDQ